MACISLSFSNEFKLLYYYISLKYMHILYDSRKKHNKNYHLTIYNAVLLRKLTVFYNYHYYLVPEFIGPNGNYMPSKQSHHVHHFPLPLKPQQLLWCCLALHIKFYLFWIFHLNRIIQHVCFCYWFLSLGIVFKVNLCCSFPDISFLFMVENYSISWI